MHRSVSLDHEMMVDGKKLLQRKELFTQMNAEGESETLIVHTRAIDDKIYTVKETIKDGETLNETVETEMSAEEVEIFKENWERMWNPSIQEESSGVVGKFLSKFTK